MNADADAEIMHRRRVALLFANYYGPLHTSNSIFVWNRTHDEEVATLVYGLMSGISLDALSRRRSMLAVTVNAFFRTIIYLYRLPRALLFTRRVP